MGVMVVLATCRKQPGLTASDELLAASLRTHRVAVTAAPWDTLEPAALANTIICLRSTWDYHTRSEEFRAWVSALRAHDVPLVNPAETVLWNMDKVYLGWLEARGIAIPETRWIAPGTDIDPATLLAAAGWEQAVLKPRVSATAYGTHFLVAGTTLDGEQRRALSRNGALLQAFVPEIRSGGEMSLVFIDGAFSHAVCKRPTTGDFRVQHEFGGTVVPAEAPVTLREFGLRVLNIIPAPWVYARVDVVHTARGPVLMELELIEPDLFFTLGPDGARRLAGALVRASSRSRGKDD